MARLTKSLTGVDAPPRALLRYFGGKWAIAPWVLQHLPKHQVYVEPFGGAASVLLRKPRSRYEVYNDLDEEIVGLLRIVQSRSSCSDLIRLLKRTAYSRKELERAFQPTADPLIRSQRAIIRAYQSLHHEVLFNTRKRPSFADARHGKAHEWATYPRALASIRKRLQGVVIECRSALDIIRVHDSADTLFFIDPPYVPSTRSKAGYRHEMTEQAHVELLDKLISVQGMVVIAGYPSDLYDSALSGWMRVTRTHRAALSTTLRTEVLWINPAAQKGLDVSGTQSVNGCKPTTQR